MQEKNSFEGLIQSVKSLDEFTKTQAKSAVNQMLTIRNWVIGCYIVNYEQKGEDRAEYGENLLEELANRLQIKGLNRLGLNLCRMFYQKYPQIWSSVTTKLKSIPNFDKLLPHFDEIDVTLNKDEICYSVSNKFQLDPEILITQLSFTHIRKIMSIDDPMERYFYELECIKCGWSVRELDRQISSKLFFRAGVSKNPKKLLEETVNNSEVQEFDEKELYMFDFLNIDANQKLNESDLEQALMDHLQDFLLEMGNGFCFEARQKRIVIDDDYYFIDLVLYNRILHCNVIIELKTDKFKPEHIGQINSYVSYYKDCEMTEGDNPPIGILMCTEKGPKMVQYVLNGMDENIFISKYMVQLPDKSQLEEFLAKEMKDYCS